MPENNKEDELIRTTSDATYRSHIPLSSYVRPRATEMCGGHDGKRLASKARKQSPHTSTGGDHGKARDNSQTQPTARWWGASRRYQRSARVRHDVDRGRKQQDVQTDLGQSVLRWYERQARGFNGRATAPPSCPRGSTLIFQPSVGAPCGTGFRHG